MPEYTKLTSESNQEPEKQEVSNLVEPGFYKSWYAGLQFLKATLLTRSKLAIAFFAVCIFDALGPAIPGINLVELGLLFFIAHDVIQRARAEKEGRPVEEVVKETAGVETTMFFNSFIFSFWFLLLSLLLVIPGLWFVSRASLAIIFVSVERKNAIDSFFSSFDLTKGHFRKTLGYMFFAPLSIFLAALSPAFFIGLLGALFLEPAGFTSTIESLDKLFDLVYFPVLNLLQVSVYIPMYDLYWYYKKLKEEKEAVSN